MNPARNGRAGDEPKDYEALQLRIQRWMNWYWRTHWKPTGRTKVELASAMELTKTTVGNVINGKELPGLEFYMRMHWRLKLDAYRMLHEDPETERDVLPAPGPTQAPPAAQKKRTAQK